MPFPSDTSRNSEYLDSSPLEQFASHPFAVAGWTAPFEISTISPDDLRDFQGVLGSINVERGNIPARFRRNNSQPFIKDLSSSAVERFARARCRHPAELFGADWNQDKSFLEPIYQLISILGQETMPSTRNAKQARTD